MVGSTSDARIEKGWKECRGWITSFDGSPTITLLVGVPDTAMFPALDRLSRLTENFRITAITVAQPDGAQFISLEAFPEHLAALRADTIADLNINYVHNADAFDLDIHLTVFAAENQQLVLELVWWSDQVFSEETDNPEQFRQLMGYFIGLQALFSASHLMVSSESNRGPGQRVDDWIEI